MIQLITFNEKILYISVVNHLPFPSLYLPYTNNLKCETIGVPRIGPTQKEVLIQAVGAISQIETSDVLVVSS